MIFESHAHYDDEAFDSDRSELLSQCQNQGIEYIVNVSASLGSVKSTLALAEEYPLSMRQWESIRMRWES